MDNLNRPSKPESISEVMDQLEKHLGAKPGSSTALTPVTQPVTASVKKAAPKGQFDPKSFGQSNKGKQFSTKIGHTNAVKRYS